MRRVTILLLLASISGCEKSDTTTTAASSRDVASLPPVPFVLKCRAGVGSRPDFAERDFAVHIDPVQKTFALPIGTDATLQSIDRTNIIMRDETTERGRDNNPETLRIAYNRETGALTYLERFSGLVPVEHSFTSKCSISLP